MVDTIEICFAGKACRPFPDKPIRWLILGHSHVRLMSKDGERWRASVELPKLLAGHNGELITDQESLTEAMRRLLDVLQEWVAFETYRIKRLDLVWHFPGVDPERFIAACQHVKLKGVPGLPTLIKGDKEISWKKNRASTWELKGYNKGGGLLRLELRLGGKPLARLMRTEALDCLNPAPLGFALLKAELERVLAPLDAPPIVGNGKRLSLAQCLAGMSSEESRSEFLLGYGQGRTRRSCQKLRKDLGNALLRNEVTRRKLMPEGTLPEPTHAPRRKKRGRSCSIGRFAQAFAEAA